MQHKPAVTLTHLITKKVLINNQVKYRHWFEWSDRKEPGKVQALIELFDQSGTLVVTATARLDRAKANESRWIQVDQIKGERPATFRYRTNRLLTTSETVTGNLNEKYEDWTHTNVTE